MDAPARASIEYHVLWSDPDTSKSLEAERLFTVDVRPFTEHSDLIAAREAGARSIGFADWAAYKAEYEDRWKRWHVFRTCGDCGAEYLRVNGHACIPKLPPKPEPPPEPPPPESVLGIPRRVNNLFMPLDPGRHETSSLDECEWSVFRYGTSRSDFVARAESALREHGFGSYAEYEREAVRREGEWRKRRSVELARAKAKPIPTISPWLEGKLRDERQREAEHFARRREEHRRKVELEEERSKSPEVRRELYWRFTPDTLYVLGEATADELYYEAPTWGTNTVCGFMDRRRMWWPNGGEGAWAQPSPVYKVVC